MYPKPIHGNVIPFVQAFGDDDITLEEWKMVHETRRILDRLVAAERQIDVLNFSGGEPLVHPDLLGLVDEALARPEIVRVSISTNGLALLARPELVDRMTRRLGQRLESRGGLFVATEAIVAPAQPPERRVAQARGDAIA